MANILTKGTPVKLKRTLLAGKVKKAQIIDDDKVHYLVEYKDGESEHERWMVEDDLEVVTNPKKGD